MKPIKVTDNTIKLMFEAFMTKYFKEEKDGSFSMKNGLEAEEKVTILFTPQAWVRMNALVEYYSTEVGWYGLVNKISDKLYRVYDVKICKQYVTGGKVDTEDADTLEFFNSLSDEEAADMHFQAHSHVNFDTTASGPDLQNQTDVIKNMGKQGFYIFQIWNKKGDINTYLYDLDNNMFYDRKDVVLEIEDEDETVSSWVAQTKELVQEKKAVQYYPSEYNQPKKKGKKKEEEETVYLNGYWNGINYNERWDW